MSVNLRELFQRNGYEFLDEPLKRAQNAPGAMLADDFWFTNTVVLQAWEHAPLQFRLAGREVLEFDKFLIEAKPQLYVEIDERIRLRLDWKDQLRAEIDKLPVAEATLPEFGQPESEDAPKDPPPAVGIDLGTTYSVVAYMDAAGRPTSIVNSVGELLTPSVVLFDTEGPVVGKEAVNGSVLEPHKVAECVKRDMGKKGYRKPINGEVLPPEVISSIILRKLRSDAERKLGPIRRAVITVPAYFDEPRRQATANAGEMAGLDVLDILNEPTAAAIAFGYQEGLLDRTGETTGGKPIRVLVYDLGGGTFDVSIVEIAAGSFQVIATDGDVYLGGKDWDDRLAGIVAERFKQVHGSDPRSVPESRQEMYLAVEAAKRTLSERPRAVVVINHEGKKLKLEVTREEFEDATAALVARTRTTAEIVVMQAKLTWADLDRVLLVGGSTRMPMISRMLLELTGKTPDRSLSPDEAVAHGAALYADMLMQKRGITEGHTDFTVGNVNSHSLGIVAIDSVSKRRINRILVAKNTRLPATVRMRFKTHRDNQKSVSIQVLEGESELPEACTQVGECVIRDLPSKLPAGWPVEVKYVYDESGRLKVTGELVGHGAKVVSEFVRDNTLPPDDLMLWAQLLEPVEELEF